jgi:hypothetical protein
MLIGGSVATLAGIILLLLGLRDATGGQAADVAMSTRGLAVLFLGAVLFAVGSMTALVALVRPFFEKRQVDRHVEGRGKR